MKSEYFIEKIRAAYKQGTTQENKKLDLPSSIRFFSIDEKKVIIALTDKGTTGNMQDDESAFESWALILKRWVIDGDFYLSWEKPKNLNDKNKLHYNRFLYRAFKFQQFFKWFHISDECKEYLNDAKIDFIKEKPSKKYVVNVPTGPRKNKATKKESKIEVRFTGEEGKSLASLTKVNEREIRRQLPVGLFYDKKSNSTRVFPGNLGQIDLWGVGKDTTTLNIYELKAGGNKPAGIVSELFFYTMFMHDVFNSKFVFHDDPEDLSPNKSIGKIKSINSYFLAPELHPLIDDKLVQIINKGLGEKNIHFDYIRFDESTLTCSLSWRNS